MTAWPSSAALDSVLARGDVWRGNGLASPPPLTLSSGFPDLDAELPGGGWPLGQLTEMLVDRDGLGELSLWLPALAALSRAGGWLALVGPPFLPFAPAWQAAGIDPARLVMVRPPAPLPEQPRPTAARATRRPPDLAWCCEQLLASGGFAAVLAWLPDSDPHCLRRLQVAASRQAVLACLWRPIGAAAQASPAPLRLAVDGPPAGSTALCLRLLKRRGAPASRPIAISLPQPGHVFRLLARPRSAESAARGARPAVVA